MLCHVIFHVLLVTFVTCHLQVCAIKKVCRYHNPAVKEGMAALARTHEQQAATWCLAAVQHMSCVTCYICNMSSAGLCHQEGLPLPHPGSERGHGCIAHIDHDRLKLV
jgi:hypothetical protein